MNERMLEDEILDVLARVKGGVDENALAMQHIDTNVTPYRAHRELVERALGNLEAAGEIRKNKHGYWRRA